MNSKLQSPIYDYLFTTESNFFILSFLYFLLGGRGGGLCGTDGDGLLGATGGGPGGLGILGIP